MFKPTLAILALGACAQAAEPAVTPQAQPKP